MANKIVKAKCKRTGKYFGLEVAQLGAEWRVVNMITLGADEARLVSSDLRQPRFVTADNLIPCTVCHSRTVGGCSCVKNRGKCTDPYHFNCIYCNELELDDSMPTADEVGALAGKKITLSQGGEVEIRYADNRPLTEILVGVGWDPARGNDGSIDVDSSVLLYSPDNRFDEGDLLYFGNLTHPSGCVIHHGDNLTGVGQGDDENINVYLNRVPADRDKLVFVLNVFSGQTLDVIRNLYIRLYDPVSRSVLVEYQVNGNSGDHNAMVIASATRRGPTWVFKAIGRSLIANNVRTLQRISNEYL